MICMRRRNGFSLPWLSLRDIGAVEDDLARGRFDEPEERAADRRLAAAGLADETEGLAALDAERDVVDRLDVGDLPVQDALSRAGSTR